MYACDLFVLEQHLGAMQYQAPKNFPNIVRASATRHLHQAQWHHLDTVPAQKTQ
jgi:hypothetical protein